MAETMMQKARRYMNMALADNVLILEQGRILAILDLLVTHQEHLEESQRESGRPPTTESPITGSQWDALVRESIPQQTPPSLQSDQLDTQNGPAEQSSECVHSWGSLTGLEETRWAKNRYLRECLVCGVLSQFGRTLAPAAEPTTSTSQRPASSPSAAQLFRADSTGSESSESTKAYVLRLVDGCDCGEPSVFWVYRKHRAVDGAMALACSTRDKPHAMIEAISGVKNE